MILALCVTGILLQGLFIQIEHQKKYTPAVILKGSASLVFVILGFYCATKSQNIEFAKMVKLGLIFGMAGDILLNLRFVFPKNGQKIFLIGILVFLTGHIMYLCALLPLCSNVIAAIIVGIILTALTLMWIFSQITAKIAFKIFGVFYIGAIVIMTTIAAFNCFSHPATNAIVFLAGAILFLISDIVLILNTFGSVSKFSLRVTNLSLYYLGRLAIACSLLFI